MPIYILDEDGEPLEISPDEFESTDPDKIIYKVYKLIKEHDNLIKVRHGECGVIRMKSARQPHQAYNYDVRIVDDARYNEVFSE